MKKSLLVLLIVLVFSLSGCSFLLQNDSDNSIETLKGWSFQYNSGSNDYSLFFGLLNDRDRYIASDVDVDIRIVNEKGEEVYSETRSVSKKDFGNYESQAAGTQYLANVRIPANEIKKGSSNNGTVYLTVYKGDAVRFDEVNCSALYCLPVSDLQLNMSNLPVEIKVKGYDGSTEAKIKITAVDYEFEKEFSPQLKIIIMGEKTFGKKNASYDVISYKLYDSNRYLIDSGNVYLSSLSAGDKFKDDSIVVYDIVPGETYSLQFSEYSW